MQPSNFSTSPPSKQSYILVINGKPEGPFSVEQLRTLNIRPGDFVKTPAMDDYKEAHEIIELRQIFHFDKQPVIPQYFAGFDQRLLASVLDWFMVAGIFILTGSITILFVSDDGIRWGIAFGLLGLIPVTNFIYHVVMECSDKQATYGKQILKIKVCDMEGERIGSGKAIARNSLKIVSLITIIGYLLSFFNRNQQCLHDMMAETLVMKDRLI